MLSEDDEAGILPQLHGYDWCEAFAYAGNVEPKASGGNADDTDVVTPAAPHIAVDSSPFCRADVEWVEHVREGRNDEKNWLCVGRLKDGRWFKVDAGCDYTGWDCQASGSACVATTRDEIIRFGLDKEQRAEFGCSLVDVDGDTDATA